MTAFKPGTRFQTEALPAFAGFPGVPAIKGTILRTPKCALPLPGPGWHVIRFDGDKVGLCMHESRFRPVAE